MLVTSLPPYLCCAPSGKTGPQHPHLSSRWVSSDGELSWGHLARPLGEAGGTHLRTTLWALGLGTELISDSDREQGV